MGRKCIICAVTFLATRGKIAPRAGKIMFTVLVGVMIMNILGILTYAQEDRMTYQGATNQIDFMFVIDSSGSMNSTDKEKIALEMIKIFVDMGLSETTRFGLVSYNGEVALELPLTPLDSQEKKEDVKDTIDGIRRRGYSDMGLGMRRGYELIQSSYERGRQPIMLVISDGENMVGNKERTDDDSRKDMDTVIQRAKEKRIPIYTIGINQEDGKEATDFMTTLRNISQATEGKSYYIEEPIALIDTFNDIARTYFKSAIIPYATLTANGQLQQVDVKIPNGHMVEGNIIFFTNGRLRNTQVYSQSEFIDFYQSKNYYGIHMKHPSEEEMKVRFQGKKGDVIRVYMLLGHHLNYQVNMKKVWPKNEENTVTIHFNDRRTGRRIIDESIYKMTGATIEIVDKETGHIEVITPAVSKEGYAFQHTFARSGDYILSMNYKGDTVYYDGVDIHIRIDNHPPEGGVTAPIQLVKGNDATTLSLENFFEDQDGDKLTIEVLSYNQAQLKVEHQPDHQLMLEPIGVGKSNIDLRIVDTEGVYIKRAIPVHTISFFQYHQDKIKAGIISLTIILIILLGIKFILDSRKVYYPYTGKINLYFMKMPDEREVRPMFFNLSKYKQRKPLSISKLLNSQKEKIPIKALEQIYLEGGENNTLNLTHNTNCAIMVGHDMVCKNKPYSLRYGNKVYMELEEGTVEIELRYKS